MSYMSEKAAVISIVIALCGCAGGGYYPAQSGNYTTQYQPYYIPQPVQSPYQVYGPLPQFNQPYNFNSSYHWQPIPTP